MSNPDLDRALKILRRSQWLADCGPDMPAAMAAAGRIVRLGKGQWTQAEGDEATGLVIIIEGALQLYVHGPGDREVLVAHVEAGAAFGQSVRFGGGPRLATAICVVPSVLMIMSDNALTRLADKRPALWRALAALAYLQLRAGARVTVELAAMPPRSRLASRLLALGMTRGTRTPLKLHIGQQALAELVGLTRKTVNGVLSSFEREGLIERGYGSLSLLDLKGLNRIAET